MRIFSVARLSFAFTLSLALFASSRVSAENPQSFTGEGLVCGVYLLELTTQEVLTHRTLFQEAHGASGGTYEGRTFFIEATRNRLFRKPQVTSEVVFWSALDTYTRTAQFQFYRRSEPNSYGFFTRVETLGPKITTLVGQERFDILDTRFATKTYCNWKRQ